MAWYQNPSGPSHICLAQSEGFSFKLVSQCKLKQKCGSGHFTFREWYKFPIEKIVHFKNTQSFQLNVVKEEEKNAHCTKVDYKTKIAIYLAHMSKLPQKD